MAVVVEGWMRIHPSFMSGRAVSAAELSVAMAAPISWPPALCSLLLSSSLCCCALLSFVCRCCLGVVCRLDLPLSP